MAPPSRYLSPAALRQALEHRLNHQAARESADVTRLRRRVAFDRFLARVFVDDDGPWLLKGGYSLELRLEEARSTRDIDLTLRSLVSLPRGEEPSVRLQAALQALADIDMGDSFVFRIAAPTLEIHAAPYGGSRFPVDARLAERAFARFHVDVGVGDPRVGPCEAVHGGDWLGFAGIGPPRIVCISTEQQFAEKLHAYTMPDRLVPNSRVKDLVDLALLVQRRPPDAAVLEEALEQTFSRRASHSIPANLADPPAIWAAPFAAMATETNLGLTLAEAFERVRAFYLSVIRSR